MARRYFGWRPSIPDQRDVLFSASRTVLETLPPAVNLVAPELPAPFSPPFDQGQLGSCGPQSACSDLIFAMLRQQGAELSTCPTPSRLFIYWCTRYLMGTVNEDSGVDNRSLLKAIARFGWCDETLWPYEVEVFRTKPADSCFTQAAERRITGYANVPQIIPQMKGCLAMRDPFIAGFAVYESIDEAEGNGGNIPMPKPRERQLGGHDVLIVGYDDAKRAFFFKNSWGQWGYRGYGWLPYEYLVDPRLASDFWTIRHSAYNPPMPPSSKTIALNADDLTDSGKAKLLGYQLKIDF